MKYLQKISPSKNYYFSKNMNHSKNNFQLPVILKGNVYNNNNNYGIFTHKKLIKIIIFFMIMHCIIIIKSDSFKDNW